MDSAQSRSSDELPRIKKFIAFESWKGKSDHKDSSRHHDSLAPKMPIPCQFGTLIGTQADPGKEFGIAFLSTQVKKAKKRW